MKLGKIISHRFMVSEVADLLVLSACMLIGEVWIEEKPDDYTYPEIEVMEPVSVKAGEICELPEYVPSENESIEYVLENPELLCLSEDGWFICNYCASSSIYLYIREADTPSREERYHDIVFLGLDLTSAFNLIHSYVRDFLDIELIKPEMETRTLRILKYPVLCEELDDSRIDSKSPESIYPGDSLNFDLSVEAHYPEMQEYDASLISIDFSESNEIKISAVKEGTVTITVDYYTEIPVYK